MDDTRAHIVHTKQFINPNSVDTDLSLLNNLDCDVGTTAYTSGYQSGYNYGGWSGYGYRNVHVVPPQYVISKGPDIITVRTELVPLPVQYGYGYRK